MSHNKETQMITTNKAVVINFPAYASQYKLTNTSTANIYIPFPVKQINVKGVTLDFEGDFKVMYFTSNLVDSGPLGSGFGGILCDYSSGTPMISYIFKQPRDINGVYDFTYNVIDVAAFYYPKGFTANAKIYNTTTNMAQTAIDGTNA